MPKLNRAVVQLHRERLLLVMEPMPIFGFCGHGDWRKLHAYKHRLNCPT